MSFGRPWKNGVLMRLFLIRTHHTILASISRGRKSSRRRRAPLSAEGHDTDLRKVRASRPLCMNIKAKINNAALVKTLRKGEFSAHALLYIYIYHYYCYRHHGRVFHRTKIESRERWAHVLALSQVSITL